MSGRSLRRLVFLTPAQMAARAAERAALVAADLRRATVSTLDRRECSTVEAVHALCATARDFSIGLMAPERAAAVTEIRRTADLVESDGRRAAFDPNPERACS